MFLFQIAPKAGGSYIYLWGIPVGHPKIFDGLRTCYILRRPCRLRNYSHPPGLGDRGRQHSRARLNNYGDSDFRGDRQHPRGQNFREGPILLKSGKSCPATRCDIKNSRVADAVFFRLHPEIFTGDFLGGYLNLGDRGDRCLANLLPTRPPGLLKSVTCWKVVNTGKLGWNQIFARGSSRGEWLRGLTFP